MSTKTPAMARSAIDATRFTATGPEAQSKGTGRSSTIPISKPGPPGETPQQRVARLRDAHRRANLAKESRFDRVVAVGRVWADRAHRFTTYSLIAFSAIGTVVAAAAIADMVIKNRRSRNEWMAKKIEEEAQEVEIAFRALGEGTATEDQMLLINQQRQKQEAAEAKRNAKGPIRRALAFISSPLSKEENPAFAASRAHETSTTESGQEAGEGLGIVKAAEDAWAKQHEEHTRQVGANTAQQPERSKEAVRGGPLDEVGAQASTAVQQTGKSWASWIRGR